MADDAYEVVEDVPVLERPQAMKAVMQVVVPEGSSPGDSFIAEVNGADFEVIVPEGFKAGDVIRLEVQNTPTKHHSIAVPSGHVPGSVFVAEVNGASVEVVVPEGCKPGDIITIEEVPESSRTASGQLSASDDNMVSDLQGAISHLKEDSSTLASELWETIGHLKEENGTLIKLRDQSEQQLSQLRSKINKLQRKNSQLQEQLENSKHEASALEEDRDRHLVKIEDLIQEKRTREENEKRIVELEGRLKQLQEENDTLRANGSADVQGLDNATSVFSFGPGDCDDATLMPGDADVEEQPSLLKRSLEYTRSNIWANQSQKTSPKDFLTIPKVAIFAEQREKELLRKKLKALQRENVKLELREASDSRKVISEDALTALQKENRQLKKLALGYLTRASTDEGVAVGLAGSRSATKADFSGGKQSASYRKLEEHKERLQQKILHASSRSKADTLESYVSNHERARRGNPPRTHMPSTIEDSSPSDDELCKTPTEPDEKLAASHSAAGAAGGNHGLRRMRSAGKLDESASALSAEIARLDAQLECAQPLSAPTKGNRGSIMRRAMQRPLQECSSTVLDSPNSPSSPSGSRQRHQMQGRQVEEQDLAEAAQLQAQLMRPLDRASRPLTVQQRAAGKVFVEFSKRWPAVMEAEFARKRIKESHSITALDRFGNSLVVEWLDGCPQLKDPPDRHAFPLTFKATPAPPPAVVLEKGSQMASPETADTLSDSQIPPGWPAVP